MVNKKFVIVIGAVVLLVVLWITIGFKGNELPYTTISELKQSPDNILGKRYRLGGIVKHGSILRNETNPLAITFILEQDDEMLPVTYHRITPDMFKDGVEVIIEGEYVNGTFQADNLMTKCASRYESDLRETKMTQSDS